MNNYRGAFADKKRYGIILSTLIVVTIIIVFVGAILNLTIKGNVLKRVTDESQVLANQQAETINKLIEEQFKECSTISAMIENGLSFYDKKDQKILESFVENNKLYTLAYADKEGNTINYQGEKLGKCNGREYFDKIISNKKSFVCNYLEKTGFGCDPCVVFSTGVFQDGKIKGVVFFSKKMRSLKDSLFQQTIFGGNESSMIVDHKGRIIAKNICAEHKYGNVENINEIHTDVKEEVTAYSSIRKNDWKLVCLIDTDTAHQKYADNLDIIRQSILLVCACFIFGIIYFVIILGFQIRTSNRRYNQYRSQYDRMLGLLRKMKCMIVEYNIKDGKITPNHLFEETFGKGIKDDFFEQIEGHKLKHPEFDFDGLVRELHYAIDNKVTTSFESIYCKDSLTYKMISIVMMPILNEKGQVMNILGSVRENSAEHLELKEKVDMFDQIPGGTYRCRLNDPLHLDYVGEKFCRMLGYTVEEFHDVVEEDYFNIIVEEDRDRFRDFIRKIAIFPQVKTCQYRILCKNGKKLSVLDTMETIVNDSGVMQGYSVVIDISEYTKRQNIVRQEVEQLEQNLEMMRIKNSTSQMQPHFLYNALSSIREVIIIDPRYASDLIYDFTVYLRACIRTMQNGDLIMIKQEIENIKAYINIEKMRMGNRLNIVYDLKSEDFKIVSLSIQPLVENAIRHGIYQRGKKGGTVKVKTETLSDSHMIIVEDDGVGFDYQKVRDEVARGERESIGLDNVIFRLTKKLNAKVVINSEIGVGTTVKVYIPRGGENHESSNTR